MSRARLLALTASSGVVLVTAVGPAAAVTHHHHPRVASGPDQLSIAVAEPSIDRGGSDTVTGVLTKDGVPQAGDRVALRARVAGHHHRAHRVATATTGADGSVSFTFRPRTTTHYRLVARAGAPTPSPTPSPVPSPVRRPAGHHVIAWSKVATVHVLRDTSLSIRAHETRRGHELIQGRLRASGHALPGRKVELRERVPGSDTWNTAKVKRTHRHGVVRFRLAIPTAPEAFQLVYAGGPNYHGCQSGVVTIG